MTIYELARALGESIRDTEETQNALAARAVFDADAEAQALLQQYSGMQQEYNNLLSAGTPDGAAVEQMGKDLRDLSHTIQENKVISNLMASEDVFNQLIKGVFTIINATITGEDNGCGGNCGGCSGCH